MQFLGLLVKIEWISEVGLGTLLVFSVALRSSLSHSFQLHNERSSEHPRTAVNRSFLITFFKKIIFVIININKKY